MGSIGKFKGYPFTQEGIDQLTETLQHLFPFLVPYVDYIIHVMPSVYCGTICADLGNLNVLMLRQSVAFFPEDPDNTLSQAQRDFLESIADPKELGLKILLDDAKEEKTQAERLDDSQKAKKNKEAQAKTKPNHPDQPLLFF